MKQRIRFLLVVACLFPAAISAQSQFDGTWKIDLKLEKTSDPPLEYVLENGEFSCKSCTPPYTVKADGQDHKLSISPYFDSMAITVVGNVGIIRSPLRAIALPDQSSWYWFLATSSRIDVGAVSGGLWIYPTIRRLF